MYERQYKINGPEKYLYTVWQRYYLMISLVESVSSICWTEFFIAYEQMIQDT